MTSVGGIIEQKPIGLQFGVEGTYDNTELVNGKVQLKQVNTDANGNPIYATQGTWISKVINIGDEFADYGKVFTAHTNSGNSSIKVETRTSSDGVTFDEYAAVGSDGTILSTKRKYIQMKVTFYSGFSDANMIISSFNSPTEASKFNNELIDTSNGLTLKRNHNFDMSKDGTWSGEGSLHKKKLLDNDWLKIDKLNVPTTGTALNKTLILHDGEYKRYVKNSLVDNSNVSIVPIMTSDTSPAPFKITASAYNASDFPYKAFNNVLDTTNRNYWYSGSTGNNHWLKVDTGEIDKYIVNKYSINSFSTYRPTGWILEGSNNDSEWTKLDERTSQSYSDNTDAFYEFSNEIAYRYYRITVKTTNSTNTSVVTPIINKFNLFGKIALEVNSWSTVSSTLPTQDRFLSDGMDSLSPLLDRRVEALEPMPMTDKSEILKGEKGKVFTKTLDLKKYIDIRKIRGTVK